MNIGERIRRKFLKKYLPIPGNARHAEYSVIYSSDDDCSKPSEKLINIALEAVKNAGTLKLDRIGHRCTASTDLFNHWPGEHYRLLAGIVKSLQPQRVIEVGTGGGGGSLALLQELPEGSRLTTFDIDGWQSHPDSILQAEDFKDGRLTQHVADLSEKENFTKHTAVFEEVDLIFLDAAKDGIMEPKFLKNLESVSFRKPPLLVLDDIRVWNMLETWRNIQHPKLDMTSFGHWTGTGFVEWR